MNPIYQKMKEINYMAQILGSYDSVEIIVFLAKAGDAGHL